VVDIQMTSPRDSATSRTWALVGVFTLSIFLSAFLLFSVQPMFTKLVLPLLGGSSSVWNTAMVFFQAILLGGYIYAHLISKYLALRWQVLCHGLVLASGLLFMPLSIASGWTPPEGGAQAYWLIGLFAVSVGVPFFAISANAPLLQRWFSRTHDKDADDPYFLYAASNAGSLLSLCLYPVLFEPLLRLKEQTQLWTYGYAALIGVILIAGIAAFKDKRIANITVSQVKDSVASVTFKRRLFWVFLAFIPSSLMLGVTSYMSNMIGSVPFLWIVPLALYLLTFIIVFAKRPIVTTDQLSKCFPFIVLLAIIAGFSLKPIALLSIILSLICYFIIALTSHSRLADLRPDVSRLTEFYIFMSLGGVLGGIFNALVAPAIFSSVYEYFIVLIVANLIVPYQKHARHETHTLAGFLLKVGLPGWLICMYLLNTGQNLFQVFVIYGSIMILVLSYMFGRKGGMWFGLVSLLGFLTIGPVLVEKPIMMDRSFYSVLKVNAVETDHGVMHEFIHGDTLHNRQFRDPDLRKTPLVYFAEGNSFDIVMKAARQKTPNLDVALIGLGAGAMSCHEQAGDNWTYLEIDQAVVDMALNPKYFTYMQDCSYKSNIVTGDARLTIQNLPEASLDLIMIDAFSSNSIPAHLLTVEALELFQTQLKDDGVMFFHTSNRSLDVSSVVVRVAESMGLGTRYIAMNDFEGKAYADTYSSSTAVLVGNEAVLSDMTQNDETWQRYIPSPSVNVWTDDYSSILGPLKARSVGDAKAVPVQN